MKAFIIATLRRASYRWKPRTEALKAARLARNTYRCAMCQGTFTRKEVQLDHIEPVIDPKVGFTTWDEYIARLYVAKEGFQVICKANCHKIKTELERAIKKQFRPPVTRKNKK